MAKRATFNDDYKIFIGESKHESIGGDTDTPTLQAALENLWENSDKDAPLHVLEIELHGSNPIDMYRVVGTTH